MKKIQFLIVNAFWNKKKNESLTLLTMQTLLIVLIVFAVAHCPENVPFRA